MELYVRKSWPTCVFSSSAFTLAFMAANAGLRCVLCAPTDAPTSAPASGRIDLGNTAEIYDQDRRFSGADCILEIEDRVNVQRSFDAENPSSFPRPRRGDNLHVLLGQSGWFNRKVWRLNINILVQARPSSMRLESTLILPPSHSSAMIASASISTSISGETSRVTSTIVHAGLISPRTSP